MTTNLDLTGLDLTGWAMRDLATDPATHRATAGLREPGGRTVFVRLDGPDARCTCSDPTPCAHIVALRQIAPTARRARSYMSSRADHLLDLALSTTEVLRRFPGGAEGRSAGPRGTVQVRITESAWTCTCPAPASRPCVHARALRRLVLPRQSEWLTPTRAPAPPRRREESAPEPVRVGEEPVRVGDLAREVLDSLTRSRRPGEEASR